MALHLPHAAVKTTYKRRPPKTNENSKANNLWLSALTSGSDSESVSKSESEAESESESDSKSSKPKPSILKQSRKQTSSSSVDQKPKIFFPKSSEEPSRHVRKVSLMTARTTSKTGQALNALKSARRAKKGKTNNVGIEKTFIDRLEDKPLPVLENVESNATFRKECAKTAKTGRPSTKRTEKAKIFQTPIVIEDSSISETSSLSQINERDSVISVMSSTPVKSCIIMPPQIKENVNDSNPTETEVFHESPIDLPISTKDHSSPSAVTPPTASITSMYMTNSTLSEILHDMSRLSIVPETNRKRFEDGLVQSIANAYAEKTAEYRSLIEEYLEPDISCHQNSLIKDRNSTSESNGVAVLPDVSLILPTYNHPDGGDRSFAEIEVSNNANSPSEKSEKIRNVSDGEEHDGARESFLQAKPDAYDSIAPAAESIYSEDSILTELDNFSGFTSAATGRVIEENAEEAPHNDELGPLPEAKTSPKQHKRFRRSFGGANTMDEAECITTHEEATITELLEICGQKKPVTFGEALSEYNLVKKLGEATFSEVYSFTTKTQDARPLAVKVMPFGAPKHKLHVNGSPQITVHEVTQEVLITKALSDFERDQNCTREVVNNKNITIGSSFVPLVNLHICKGTYSFELLEAWDTWTETKDSENDRPDFFPKSQLFVVIVLANGGTDLEHFKIRPISTGPMPSTPLIKSRGLNSTTAASSAAPNKTWAMVTSILQQTILSLYIAERDLKFEHRDLHWGNILCQTNPEYAAAAKEYYCGEELGWIRVPLEGVKVTIIDYTLSRCQSGKRLFFNRMDDESFYTGEGDYQFDIYRMMREETRGDWMAFHPKTNVLWIHYLLHKLLKGKSLPVAGAVAKEKRKELEGFQKRVLSYASVRELVERDVMFETNYLKDV